MLSWIFLAVAIVLEVAGTTAMKLSDGLTKLVPSLLIFVFYAGSFAVMSLALKKLDVGLVYAIWAGVGTALITLIGVAMFSETLSWPKVASIGLIVVGVAGLYLSDGG